MAYERVSLERFFEQLKVVARELERHDTTIIASLRRIHPDLRAPGHGLKEISRKLLEIAVYAEGYFVDVPAEIEFGEGVFGSRVQIAEARR